MIDQLPRRGEVATEFRSLASNVSDEVFSSVFPNIYRLLTENQERSEKTFSESISGTRSIELQVDKIDNSLNEMNFELEKLKRYQNASLDLLENLKDTVNDASGPGALLGKLIGKIFQGARKAAAKKDAKKVDKEKQKEKFRNKFRTKNKLLNAILMVLDVYQILSDLQPEIEKIEKIPEKKNTKNKNVLNFLEKNTTSSENILPSDKLISDNTKPDLKPMAPILSAVNIGSKNPATIMDDDVTAAKDIIFGARKMKFVGENLSFINIPGIEGEGKGKILSSQNKQQNKTSSNVENLKKKNEESASSGGGTTPGSTEGGGSTPSSSGGGSTGVGGGSPSTTGTTGSGINFGETPKGPPFSGSQDEAFKKIEEAAKAAGSTDPRLTASIAMLESGYLTSRMARGNNPFGQTITRSQIGSDGIVGGTVGADGQLHAVYDSLESAVRHHVRKWGGRYSADAKDSLRNLVAGGYNTVNPNWAPSIYSIYQKGGGRANADAVTNQNTQQPAPQNQQAVLERSNPEQPNPQNQQSIPNETSQRNNQEQTNSQNQQAVPVETPPRTPGQELRRSSANAVSIRIENPEESAQRLQQLITNNNQTNIINNQYQSTTTTNGSPATAEVSSRERILQQFSQEP